MQERIYALLYGTLISATVRTHTSVRLRVVAGTVVGSMTVRIDNPPTSSADILASIALPIRIPRERLEEF